MQWGVNFLAVYSLMVVVAAMQVGVGNGFVVLMAGMVWLGCMAADVLLGTKESEKYTRFCLKFDASVPPFYAVRISNNAKRMSIPYEMPILSTLKQYL